MIVENNIELWYYIIEYLCENGGSMKVLMINKFLYPNGGSETYLFKLGEYLSEKGHSVEYFGMEHEGRKVGNSADSYTKDMDFHGGSVFSKLTYPIKTIYSSDARKRIRAVLEKFDPDVCHLNNFNFQLTPSIILEIDDWRKKTGKKCKILYTAHDGQLVCPNHLMQNPITGEKCQKCFGGKFINCLKGKCIHSSSLKSLIGAMEGYYWNSRKVYSKIDTVIAPSKFIADCLLSNPIFKDKTVVLNNFTDSHKDLSQQEKDDYVLYFGRYSKEKGIGTFLEAVDRLPFIKFVFAGNGPLKEEIDKRENAFDKGFLEQEQLIELISKAKFTVIPSECYENCPFSVIESQICATPVLGARIGGIPELIRENETGELFESGNTDELTEKIKSLFTDEVKLKKYSENCKECDFITTEKYYEKLIGLYS